MPCPKRSTSSALSGPPEPSADHQFSREFDRGWATVQPTIRARACKALGVYYGLRSLGVTVDVLVNEVAIVALTLARRRHGPFKGVSLEEGLTHLSRSRIVMFVCDHLWRKDRRWLTMALLGQEEEKTEDLQAPAPATPVAPAADPEKLCIAREALSAILKQLDGKEREAVINIIRDETGLLGLDRAPRAGRDRMRLLRARRALSDWGLAPLFFLCLLMAASLVADGPARMLHGNRPPRMLHGNGQVTHPPLVAHGNGALSLPAPVARG